MVALTFLVLYYHVLSLLSFEASREGAFERTGFRQFWRPEIAHPFEHIFVDVAVPLHFEVGMKPLFLPPLAAWF